MKKVSLVLLALFLISIISKADEGMWLLNLVSELNISRMHDMGCKLSADEIYNINQSSLKDAVVIFGTGCTGEMVSEQGLLFTNHHCGYDAIQYFSSVDHDYLNDGYWAVTKDKELPVPDLTVTFLISIEDVTAKILDQVDKNMGEVIRDSTIKGISGQLEEKAVEGTSHQAKVVGFYGGNTYYLFVYNEYKDIRLVGAPPSSIGKFGGETDNWMWPRQTGDFSIFRVYADSSGNPAPYSKNNIPLKPKRHLTISLKGVEKNDFAMIMGYPGSTDRYMTSYGIKELLETDNPHKIKIRGIRQEILMHDMIGDPSIRIKYAEKYERSANDWKYYIGEDKGLVKQNILQKKTNEEEAFKKWIGEDPERKLKYGNTLGNIEDAISSHREYHLASLYLDEALFSAEALSLPVQFLDLFQDIKSKEINLSADMIETYRNKTETFFKDYNLSTDKKVAAAMLRLYFENVNKDLQPDFMKNIQTKYKGDYTRFVDILYSKTIFTDKQKLLSFLDKPSYKLLEKDELFKASVSILNLYFNIYGLLNGYDEKLNRGNRDFIAGIVEMKKDVISYPDANFTMRLTYGRVNDYYPRDGVHYNYYTTLKGVIEKEDPNNIEFVVPQKLKDLYNTKNYGRYGKDGEMHLCFTTDNDITGGNSGSPVLNANGELVGLAFDGNWEAMSSDIIYEPDIQKTICVDIRYVLFIIDKFAGAENIIDELNIVN
jgi:hypothetical protein